MKHVADHLLSIAVPQVVKSCADFIEKHGVVDGIYRLSGISSNIQKLRFVPAKSKYNTKQFLRILRKDQIPKLASTF